MFTLQNSLKPLLLKGGRGEKNLLVEVTVNSKEENSLKTFVPISFKNSASGLYILNLHPYVLSVVRVTCAPALLGEGSVQCVL
jgi:hypothetical protein